MFDHLIRGGLVLDGTGGPGRRADIGIRAGRIEQIGTLEGADATKTFDATGLVVAPGFIDIHTHYDAQLHWDGYATPSSLHGVTTVIGGNCGFTLAPLKQRDADYTRRMMAQVEGMPLAALEEGLDWSWESFGDYLSHLDGRVAVNSGFLVGHCAIRRYVLGEASLEREATPTEVDEMVALLHQSLAAGGLGFSTTRSRTHPDHLGGPVPSRQASEGEVLALCRAVADHPGTTLEAITSGCISGFSEEEIELLAQMSAHAGRTLNWNVLNIGGAAAGTADDEETWARIAHQLRPSVRAREIGGRVLALTMPTQADLNMSMATYCAMWLIPGWREVLTLPPAEKAAKLRDPEVRATMLAAAVGSGLERFADFGSYRIGDTVADANKQYEDRVVRDIAEERGVDVWNALVDIEIADDFNTVLWPERADDERWDMRVELWRRDDVMLGGSDAGAHLDRMLGSTYTTTFLADVLRGRKPIPLEEAVQLMTSKPAEVYGLRDRGVLREGAIGDVVVFDPETVGSARARRAYDLPGESLRLTAASSGVELVLVNGVETIVAGEPTGALAGTVLRSGRDTETVPTR
jgi:N-acyl-D-aspartate/D-glutamate deacylase